MSHIHEAIASNTVVEDTLVGNDRIVTTMTERIAMLQDIIDKAQARNASLQRRDYTDADVRDDLVSRALGLAINTLGNDGGEEVTVHLPFLFEQRDVLELPVSFLDVFDSYAEYTLGEEDGHTTITVRNITIF